MPQLKKRVEKREKFYLPSTANEPDENKVWVEVNLSGLSVGDMAEAVRDEDSNMITGVKMLARRIVSWNVTDENNAPLPITFENVQMLDMADFTYLAEKVKLEKASGLSIAEKKV